MLQSFNPHAQLTLLGRSPFVCLQVETAWAEHIREFALQNSLAAQIFGWEERDQAHVHDWLFDIVPSVLAHQQHFGASSLRQFAVS